jgi:hypothetical protein
MATRVPQEMCVATKYALSSSEVLMHVNFDIFKRPRNGQTIWITSVRGIEEARLRINRLGVVAPGEYLIYSRRKGLIVESINS